MMSRSFVTPLILVVLTAGLLAGCATSNMSGALYNVGLDEVERPADAKERYGEYDVVERDTTEGTKYIYEDDLVEASFYMGGGSILTNIRNKTDYSIKVRIADGAFVSSSGQSDRLVTGNMSYANRNESPQPLIVPQNASSSTTLIPVSNISLSQYSGVNVDPIIRPSVLKTADDTTAVRENIGRTFRLLLPIEIQGTTNEYTFSFTVRGARITDLEGTNELTFGEDPPEKVD